MRVALAALAEGGSIKSRNISYAAVRKQVVNFASMWGKVIRYWELDLL